MALLDDTTNALTNMVGGKFDPSDPSYQFRLQSGLDAGMRGMSKYRGSGAFGAGLANYASGLASTEYGNQFNRLAGLQGQEQGNNVAMEGNRLTGVRDANAFTLGTQQNDNTRRGNDQQFGLGMVNANNNAQNNAWNAQNNAWSNWNTGNRDWWNNQNQQFSNNTQRGTAMNNYFSQFFGGMA